jgi:hypothetical protein
MLIIKELALINIKNWIFALGFFLKYDYIIDREVLKLSPVFFLEQKNYSRLTKMNKGKQNT